MSYVNTRTSMGEQAAFDALIAGQLTEVIDDAVLELRANAFLRNNTLVSVNFPSVRNIRSGAFAYCQELRTVDIGSQCTIQSGVFSTTPKLSSLILRESASICALSSYAALSDTNFALLKGVIYVPQALLASYKEDRYWAYYKAAIRSIEEMPVADLCVVTETWTELKNMVEDESFFSSGYMVGDLKHFSYNNQTDVFAEIAKIDLTNKYVDFIIKHVGETSMMKSGSTATLYGNSVAKSRLDEIYENELPSDMKAAITPVTKKYYAYDGTTEEVTAPIWLLNSKDVNFSGNYLKESEGENYTIFNSNSGRSKFRAATGAMQNWWLGSAYDLVSQIYVSSEGSAGSANSLGNSLGLIFGFRIQKTT